MRVQPARVGAYGGLTALVVSLVLVIVSMLRQSPGGAGENIEWLLSYLMLLGFPTSLGVVVLRPLGPTVIRVGFVLAAVLNWALISYCVAKLASLLRRAA